MIYGDAQRLLAKIRQERPELFTGTVSRQAINPHVVSGGWLVHIGPQYQIIIHDEQEWQAFQAQYPSPDSVPAHLTYAPGGG